MLIDNAVEAAVPADHVNRARDFYADKLGLTPVSEFAGMQLSDRTGGAQPCNPQGGWQGVRGRSCSFETAGQWWCRDDGGRS